jgi:hypothetical protein
MKVKVWVQDNRERVAAWAVVVDGVTVAGSGEPGPDNPQPGLQEALGAAIAALQELKRAGQGVARDAVGDT